MSKIMIHCGGKVVDLPALAEVELPEKTSTYQPVAHYDLAETVKSHATQLLRMECVGETYALAKDGARMFGLQTFNGNGNSDEYGFSVAFRNSYDKSMSLGLAAGFKVFVCDNLAINGEINIMRRHTGEIWNDLENMLIVTLFKKGPEIRERFAQDVHNFKQFTIDRPRGWEPWATCWAARYSPSPKHHRHTGLGTRFPSTPAITVSGTSTTSALRP